MTKHNKKYDYIVVGSGPGGCAVSQMLTSNKKNKVIMIEAGDDMDNEIPIKDSTYAGLLEEDYYPQYFWVVQQMVQENADMPTANYTNGRCFGGGSSVNGEQYVRGSTNVFNKWYEITNDKDWSPESIYDTYVKFEKLLPVISGPSQGYDGFVSVRQAPETPTNTANKFVEAAITSLNLPEIIDYNNPSTQFGPFTRWQYYQKPDGTRESSSTALLKPILMEKHNFTMSANSTVFEIIWSDKKKNKAIGVKFLKDGVLEEVYAKKGVILSAGTQTPIILQHSGIGPADRLKQFKIPVVSNLENVGEKLVNHLLLSTTFSKDPNDLPSTDKNALYSFGAFYPQPTNPDIIAPRGSEWIGIDLGNAMMIVILQSQPFSKGFVHIQSKDVLTTPLVTEAALEDDRDLVFFKDIVRNQLLPLAQQLAINTNGTYQLLQPDPNSCGDDDYLTDYIRGNLDHAHHWQSQCIMAPYDQGGVVDSNGQVYGTHNLFIADDCIVPFTIDNNTAGIAYAIGYTIGKKLLKRHKH